MSIFFRVARTSRISGREDAFLSHIEVRNFHMHLVNTQGSRCANGLTSLKDMLEHGMFSQEMMVGFKFR
jgi:hypothetical protein